jgi:hypothetical protein
VTTETHETTASSQTPATPGTLPSTQSLGSHTSVAPDGARVGLDPALSDETLRAWRQAAISGGLPEPSRPRWQQLRAGVVNMWEFDAAEYWSAQGRAQFVGGNEQGKSTMMTMTTLTMLTGDLSPRYVDTFGESHRSFRYYLEPTEDPKDRRPTKDQLNRGWTWVEYGRLTDTGPEYFTALLFVQARRTSKDMHKSWITHRGPERVRAGLTLVREQSALTPSEISALTPHKNGAEYTMTVASVLFGFSDQQRLRTVVELLKTLRTPKLGNRLNPEWVVDRIREALPPLAADEITSLAEGWDQLGQLAADRDAAREAQDAVTAYLKSTWNPWADAVLRRAADDLVSAVTVLDDVTRQRGRAAETVNQTGKECEDAKEREQQLDADRDEAGRRRTTLVESHDYRAAATAGQQVTDLRRRLDQAHAHEEGRLKAAVDAAGAAATVETQLEEAAAAVEQTRSRLDTQTDRVAAAGTDAGIAAVDGWAHEHDTARILTAVTQRQGHIREARKLQDTLTKAMVRHEHATSLLQAAEDREGARQKAHGDAAAARDTAGQALSDGLEAWAATLTGHQSAQPPTVAVRERWLESVFITCDQPRPTQKLTGLIQEDWLAPALAPVERAAITAANKADQARSQAADADEEADRVASEPSPQPADPHLWRRRTRPAPSASGAPLWQLLDPLPGLGDTQVAAIEAALAGAGLLDAWVTPDGVWTSTRDGEDHVLGLLAPVENPGAVTLGSVLTVAEHARPGGAFAGLDAVVEATLAAVGWHRDSVTDAGASGTTPGVHVGGDGSWSTPTTSGRAVVPAEGASLLGASAQEAARARRVATLRESAATLRAQADELDAQVAEHRTQVDTLRSLAKAAPTDAAVIDAARTLTAAAAELETAAREREYRAREATRAEEVRDQANAALVTYAAEHHLIVTRLAETETALHDLRLETERLASRISDLTRERTNHTGKQDLFEQLSATARGAATEAAEATASRVNAQTAFQAATDALDATDQELLEQAAQLAKRIDDLDAERKAEELRIRALSAQLGKAQEVLSHEDARRAEAEESRTEKLTAWWVPVDAGLAEARGLQGDDDARTLTAALGQARHVRTVRNPRGWPDSTSGASGDKERERVLNRLRDRLSGAALLELNNILNRTGGRTAIVETDEPSGLPQVRVLVDASGAMLEPVAAVRALAAKAAELGELHDEQMHEVMAELLSSTFVDHLREQVKETERLIGAVNQVLAKHPTGTTKTVLRLHRKAVPEHAGGYQVLQRLLNDGVESPAVQQQVQQFLTSQIRAAQDEGQAESGDWKEVLVDKLDYRNWFAVVTQWRVLTSAKDGGSQQWHELTTQRHGQDSGGGKVMTMLQPLLATLATLYQGSPSAPRPLWLDEAFDGVDAENTTSLLGMLVEFDFDFLLAGPKSLVASRHVPCAAVWMVHRSPAPLPGVDLGLWLYAGGTQEHVPVDTRSWADPTPGSGPGSALPAGLGTDPDGDAASTEADNGTEDGLWA